MGEFLLSHSFEALSDDEQLAVGRIWSFFFISKMLSFDDRNLVWDNDTVAEYIKIPQSRLLLQHDEDDDNSDCFTLATVVEKDHRNLSLEAATLFLYGETDCESVFNNLEDVFTSSSSKNCTLTTMLQLYFKPELFRSKNFNIVLIDDQFINQQSCYLELRDSKYRLCKAQQDSYMFMPAALTKDSVGSMNVRTLSNDQLPVTVFCDSNAIIIFSKNKPYLKISPKTL
ncbi:hypothetical protein P9112_010393 [Eukaryota sp. TZLM1-RC]